jgi:type IV secretion system protein TrbB
MVNREVLEIGAEQSNGKDAANHRRLEKLRRDFGPTFLVALADPLTIEILLNADGTLWQEKLGGKMKI